MVPVLVYPKLPWSVASEHSSSPPARAVGTIPKTNIVAKTATVLMCFMGASYLVEESITGLFLLPLIEA